jgi:hypothetical protein
MSLHKTLGNRKAVIEHKVSHLIFTRKIILRSEKKACNETPSCKPACETPLIWASILQIG